MTSNASLSELQNDFLLELLSTLSVTKHLHLAKYHSFRNTLLPSVMDLLHETLERKLQKSVSICLIVDFWSKASIDYIALGAAMINDEFERDIVILSMMRMSQPHNSEYVKLCVEHMINQFQFDKSLVHCNLTNNITITIYIE